MKVHCIVPYDLEKNLGRAYNETMRDIPEDDWCCLCDQDILFLTTDSGHILHGYAERYPESGILTCLTNRVSTLSHMQLLNGVVSENSDIRQHIPIAQRQKQLLYTVLEIQKDISGFLMLISKKAWNKHKFSEDRKCLGVDTEYNRMIRAAGEKIYLMQGLYVFHIYRLMNGINDKRHLL